jgi:hypothetical protein
MRTPARKQPSSSSGHSSRAASRSSVPLIRARFPAPQINQSADSRSTDRCTLRFRKLIIGQHRWRPDPHLPPTGRKPTPLLHRVRPLTVTSNQARYAGPQCRPPITDLRFFGTVQMRGYADRPILGTYTIVIWTGAYVVCSLRLGGSSPWVALNFHLDHLPGEADDPPRAGRAGRAVRPRSQSRARHFPA